MSPTAADIRIVLVTAPPDAATHLARTVVEEGLAACTNVVPGLRSIYRWKGGVQDDPETLLIMKAPAAQVDALIERVVQLHPADTPEVLALTPDAGFAPYLQWVLGA